MNKKGVNFAIDSMPFYIAFLIILGLMFVIFVVITRASTTNYYEYPEGVEEYLASSRFSHCFIAEYYPFAIDWNAFTENHLNECYPIDKQSSYFAYRLRLTFADEEKVITTLNWNDKKEPSKIRRNDVQIIINGILQRGILFIEVQHE